MGIREIQALTAGRTGQKVKDKPEKDGKQELHRSGNISVGRSGRKAEKVRSGQNGNNRVKKPAKKAPAKIKPRSKKQAKTMRDLAAAYGPFLESHPDCAIKSPSCLGPATAVHHSRGRGIRHIFDQKTWIPCCPPCNSWVESNHAEAAALGLMKSKLAKE